MSNENGKIALSKGKIIALVLSLALIVAGAIGLKLIDDKKEYSGLFNLDVLNYMVDYHTGLFQSYYSQIYHTYIINDEENGDYVLCVAKPDYQIEDYGGVDVSDFHFGGTGYNALTVGPLCDYEFTDDCLNYSVKHHSRLNNFGDKKTVYCIFENPTVDSVTVNGQTVKVEKFKMTYNNREVEAGIWAVLLDTDEEIVVS